MILTLLAGSAGLLYTHFDAWFVWRVVPAIPEQQGGLVSPDGRYFALCGWRDSVDPPDSHQLLVFEIASGAMVYKHEYGATEHEWGASFPSTSGYLLLYENGEHLIDLQSGKELSLAFDRCSFSGASGEIALLFRNDADLTNAELWNLAAGKCIKRFQLLSHLENARLDHEQKSILLTKAEERTEEGSKKCSSMIWDIDRGESTVVVPGRSISDGFSADDKYVITREYLMHEERSKYFVTERATGKL